MATSGEYALEVLDSFETIYVAVDNDAQPEIVTTDQFVLSSLQLRSTFPGQAKISFAQCLPLTDLEVHMLSEVDWTKDDVIRQKLSYRLAGWVSLSSMYIDERNVTCSDFLYRLHPNLDREQDRTRVNKLYEKLTPDMTH